MRDIIQKSSNTDKQITSALRRSVWLSYLLSLGALSAGGLSIFSIAAVLEAKPAQANMKEQTAGLPVSAVEDKQALPTSTRSSEPTCLKKYHQDLVNISGHSSPPSFGGADECLSEVYEQSDPAVRGISEPTVGLSSPIERKQETLQTLGNKEQNESFKTSFSTAVGYTVKLPVEISSSGNTELLASEYLKASNVNEALVSQGAVPSADRNGVWSKLVGDREDKGDKEGKGTLEGFSSLPTPYDHIQALELWALGDEPTSQDLHKFAFESLPVGAKASVPQQYMDSVGKSRTVELADTSKETTVAPVMNSVEHNNHVQLMPEDKPTTVESAKLPKETEVAPAVYSGPGGASLLGGTIRAQASVEGTQESPSPASNSPPEKDPLAPTLTLQGVYLYQGDSAARARLTGIYPISPNALVGGSLDLSSGDAFNIGRGGGLQLNELYFTGSLPSMPSLRMSVGLLDLTSYFDRNSFAKDSATHFFNPVFETNPALAAAGVASRPGILLNWDITDDFQARAAAFSSHRNLGSFAIDGFAGELAYRSGNAIVRGTFATDRDAGRDDGFKEIYGIRRDNGDFGLRSGDREIAYGINGEYYIPEIKMGLFGRYGRYEDTTLGKGGDTYSLGLNFLDLFMPDDRLGFGYGRDLSNNDLRRANGNKVPDVWEVFYDFRVTSYLRAGVTLQAREEFSDIVAGFRVRTDIDLLGRLFR